MIRLDSISRKLVISTILLASLVLGALGLALVAQQARVLQGMMQTKAEGLVKMMGTISVPYVINYDLSALEGFVKEAGRDPDVAYAEYRDAAGKPLTANTLTAAQKVGLSVHIRDVVDGEGRKLGTLEIGFRTTVIDQARLQTLAMVTASISLALLLLALGIGLIVRVVTRPAAQILDRFTRLGEGDLTTRMTATTRDEFGRIVTAFDQNREKLHALMSRVRHAGHAVGTSSNALAGGHAELAVRSEQQATALEETASSMEQLTATVAQNADNARQASQLAEGASVVARRGGEVVGQVVRTMTAISDSSKKIADIIGVIDAIAFQTNILALNAAVEAARAGEQGRGFAVVAAEVRSLAQRSATAAKEIKGLIGTSVGQVKAGNELVESAGQTMQEIVGSVKRVTDLIAEIAAASQEQSSGIQQVNTAINQMDRVVQQNATLVEVAAASTEAMNAQAGELLAIVALFNLDGAAEKEAGAAAFAGHQPSPGARFAPALMHAAAA
ncbi:MAG: tar4 [Ramlibacter sp.]|nr:tar4 [Ramlibacter sp.]